MFCLGSEVLSRSSHSLKHTQPWWDDTERLMAKNPSCHLLQEHRGHQEGPRVPAATSIPPAQHPTNRGPQPAHHQATPPAWHLLPTTGTAGPCWLSPHQHGGPSRPRTCVSGRGGVRRPRPTRRRGPGARGACPVPDPPLFSQGLRFQRSPWDPAPSPRPHTPRKIGSAGACLFAVAAAPACDYSCSAAGRCGALCTSTRLPHGAGTPHVAPRQAGVSPLPPSIHSHWSQGTSALGPWGTG